MLSALDCDWLNYLTVTYYNKPGLSKNIFEILFIHDFLSFERNFRINPHTNT